MITLIKSKYPPSRWITRNISTIILNIEEKSYLRHSEDGKKGERENKTWPRRRVTIFFLAHQLQHTSGLFVAKEPQRDEPRADPFSILGSENVSAVSISLLDRIDARHKLNWKHEDPPKSIAWRSRETWSNLNIKGTSWPNRKPEWRLGVLSSVQVGSTPVHLVHSKKLDRRWSSWWPRGDTIFYRLAASLVAVQRVYKRVSYKTGHGQPSWWSIQEMKLVPRKIRWSSWVGKIFSFAS